MNELLSCYFHFMLKYTKPKNTVENETLELPNSNFLVEHAIHIKKFQSKYNNLTMANQFHLIVIKLKKINRSKKLNQINKEVLLINDIYEKMMFEMKLEDLFSDGLIDKKEFKCSKIDNTTSEIYYKDKLVYCGDYISRKRLANTKLDIITTFIDTGENWLFNEVVTPIFEARYNAMLKYMTDGILPNWASEEYDNPTNNKNKLLLDLYYQEKELFK